METSIRAYALRVASSGVFMASVGVYMAIPMVCSLVGYYFAFLPLRFVSTLCMIFFGCSLCSIILAVISLILAAIGGNLRETWEVLN